MGPGQQHDPAGCDVARCAATGEQWIQCPGELHEYNGREYGEHEGVCQPTIWTGQWPGEMEATEFGWYSYFDVDSTAPGAGPYGKWVTCDDDPTRPGAKPDLNRVNEIHCTWSVEQQRWVQR